MTDLEFRMLGPLEVLRQGVALPLSPGRPRLLLALLLVHANEVVPTDRLLEDLWRGQPPPSAPQAVQVYVSNLRKLLEPERPSGGPARVLITRQPGYVLEAPPEHCDARRFEVFVSEGGKAVDDHRWADATRILDEALALWRGRVLADLADEPFVQSEAVRLEDLRLVATERRIEAQLALGCHRELVSELEALIRQYPFREQLWARLMVALYRSGRQADALRAFQRLREVLGEELGLEPSPELCRLEAAVLRHDPQLTLPVIGTGPESVVGPPAPLLTGSALVTFMLTDIEASTAAWEAEPAPMAAALARHDSLVAEVVTAHCGQLLKTRGEGDSTFSVFERASAAVAAAWTLRQALADEPWPTSTPVRVRVAIHTGEAEVRDGDYFGRAVNRAARLRSVACGGQVLLSRGTADLVADTLPTGSTLVYLGDRKLRDLRRPEHVFELRAESPAPDEPQLAGELRTASVVPLPSLLTDMGPIFVGRDRELELLEQLWKEAAEGELRAALLAGEPGVGKTRLAAEIAVRVHEQGALVLAGRCDEDLGVPYQPFVDALRQFLDHTPTAELWARLGRFGGELVRLVPDLSDRLPDLPPPLRSDPETERYRLFDAVAAWLAAVSAEVPILLVLDDLQWAAKPTLLLLRHVTRSSEAKRVLVLGTYRDTELDGNHPVIDLLADLRRQASVQRLALTGLDQAAVAALVEQASRRTLDDDLLVLARTIQGETQGNPFFVREVLRHLAETGGVDRPEDGSSPRPPLEALGIPEGVRDVVGKRLARLSDETNHLLQVAAVVGAEFEPALLAAGDTEEDRLISSLEEATAARLVAETDAGRYRFAHALVRDTLYDQLSALRRMALHRRVAEAIETMYADHLDDHLAVLAHHFARAGAETSKAIEYATRAGDRAMSQLAFDAAAAHYEQALNGTERMAHDNSSRRGALLLALGEARARSGDPRAAEAYLSAVELARRSGDAELLARAALGMTDLWGLTGTVDDNRTSLLDEARAALGRTTSPLTAQLLARLATELYFVPGSWDRREALSAESIEAARRLGDPLTLASSLHARNYALWAPGGAEERLAIGREIVDLAHQGGDPELALHGHAWCQTALLELGDVAGLDVELAAYERLADELRQPRYRWYAATRRAMRVLLAGDLDRGERLVQEARDLGKEAGEADAENVFGGQMLVVWHERPCQEAIDHTDARYRVAETTLPEDSLLVLALRLWRLLLVLDTPRRNEAEAELAPLLGFALEKLDPTYYGMGWSVFAVSLTTAAVRLSSCEEAATLYDLLLPHAGSNAQDCGAVAFLGAYSHHLGVLATTLAQWDRADEHLAAAAEAHERMGARAYLARTRLEWARMLFTRRKLGDVERGRKLLDQVLGAVRELGLPNVERQVDDLRT
jgi:DNA-binding SARP family transcriptional activator